MSDLIAIAGGSGSGKTTSLRNLNPKETFIVSITGKPLPFKGFKKNYSLLKKEGNNYVGNFYKSKNVEDVIKVFKLVSTTMPEIKQIIVDDANYLMSFEVMERANEKGWDKSTQIAKHYYDMLEAVLALKDDLKVVILSHTENLGDTLNPQWKLKTAGKMLDTQLNVDGLFTYILYTEVSAGEEGKPEYKFRTNTIDGSDTCKTPMDCFEELYVDNDLQVVLNKIDEYNND
jgi:glycosyltransferase involved in cell wall biosynthesis